MPWDATTFARHNHGLSGAQSAHAARIANAVLGRGAPEGEAIAVANKWAQHRRAMGGLVPQYDDGGGVGGLSPAQTQTSPLLANLVSRYNGLPTERLQELQGMLSGSPQGQIIRQVLMRRLAQPNAGGAIPGAQQGTMGLAPPRMPAPSPMPQAPSPVGTMQTPVARGGLVPQRAAGGTTGIPMGDASPWWERREATAGDQRPGGFLAGTTMGRADAVQTTAPGGSYIIPAEVVAHLGEGNNLAGARVLDEVLRSGPFGIPQLRGAGGHGAPRAPAPLREEAKGGGVQAGTGETPVALSHGEYWVAPETVRRIGGGDSKRGIAALDKFVEQQHKKHMAALKAYPGPVKEKAA